MGSVVYLVKLFADHARKNIKKKIKYQELFNLKTQQTLAHWGKVLAMLSRLEGNQLMDICGWENKLRTNPNDSSVVSVKEHQSSSVSTSPTRE